MATALPGAGEESPSFLTLSTTLLELYRLAESCPADDFQNRAFNAAHVALPFDSGIWVTGRMGSEGPIVHSVHMDNQPPEMMADYERVKHLDILAMEAFQSLGQSVVASTVAEPWRARFHPDMVAHGARFGMSHMLCTIIANPTTHLFTAVSFYRADPDRPYTESDRLLKQALTPHLAECWSLNQLNGMREEATSVDETPARAQAICDRQGFLHTATEGFVALLRMEWPEWQGPQLPPDLVTGLPESRWRWNTGNAIVVTGEGLNDQRLITARRKTALDQLSQRELEIARRFGNGMEFRDIADELGLAPATVRNHVQAIYEKLGIHGKVDLALLLRKHRD